MSPERFDHLLTLVGPLIVKQPCHAREPISPGEKLMVTLRYLATGESQQSLSFHFRLGRSTISHLLRETCDAVWEALSEDYLKTPSSTADWINISEEFEEEWNFPHCIGALDGKHIMMECPQNGGSLYYNYKHFHSIVLLAVCDAKYCFSFIDIGAFGGNNDAAVLSDSAFGQSFDNSPNKLNIPAPAPHGSKTLPYVLLGDDIFPLKPWLLKPYPGKKLTEEQRVYNYRLSRARRTIENAFGILSTKWRIFRTAIKANVDLVESIVKSTVCLHNYLRLTDNASYTPEGFIDSEDSSGQIIPGDWRKEVDNGGMVAMSRIGSNRFVVKKSIISIFFILSGYKLY